MLSVDVVITTAIMGYGIIRLMPVPVSAAVLLIAAANNQRGYLLALHFPPDKVLITTNKLAVGESYKENPDMTTKERRRKKSQVATCKAPGHASGGVACERGSCKGRNRAGDLVDCGVASWAWRFMRGLGPCLVRV
ncbi:hypothetical protein LI328DRAFT_128239 [Trichoderma asperelloides]|nr:hypothetical protein LI328DRAFT_128239 [Trichoderma asperelloides]